MVTSLWEQVRSEGREGTAARPSPGRSAVAAILLVLLAQAAGLVGIPFTARGTDSWYDGLDKPWFNPPEWVFGPTWTTLYLLIGIAAWLVWRTGPSAERTTALTWWGIQLVLNALWSPIFFGAQLPWAGLVDIVLLVGAVVVTMVTFRRIHTVAALLLAPYLAWILFATLLNASIAVMN